MIEQVTKLRVELTNELTKTIEAYNKNPEEFHDTIQALLKNMGLLNDIACRVLEMTIYNHDRLSLITTWLEDQTKLLGATKARLDVFGPPKV